MGRVCVVFVFVFLCLPLLVVAHPCSTLNSTQACVISGQAVVVDGSVVFDFASIEVTNGASLSCEGELCRLSLQAGDVRITQNSVVSASIVNISASSLFIDDSSFINVTARGFLKGPGEPLEYYGNGASFGGHGGGPFKSVLSYGKLDLVSEEDEDILGSGAGSPGGGAIRIYANDIHIDGRLLADGGIHDTYSGGSGGSISIRPRSVPSPSFSGSGRLSANAASTQKRLAVGSGGGRVFIAADSMSIVYTITAYGDCKIARFCGAPGTIFLSNSSMDNGTDMLIVASGSSISTTALTPIITTLNVALCDVLVIEGGACVAIDGLELRVTDSISLYDSSKLMQLLVEGKDFLSVITPSFILFDRSMLEMSRLYLDVDSFQTSSDTRIVVVYMQMKRTAAVVKLKGAVKADVNFGIVALLAQDIFLDSMPSFQAAYIQLKGARTITVRDTHITATARHCDREEQRPSMRFDCTSFDWSFLAFPMGIKSNLIVVSAVSSLVSSRMLVCASSLVVFGSMDTSGRGCLPNDGMDSSYPYDGCARRGASHGGAGGAGAPVVNGVKCNASELTFDDPQDPIFTGTGGGIDVTESTESCSAGGGTIFINSTILHLGGLISADGQRSTADISTKTGAGGGAGGTISIGAVELHGNGNVTATGGNGLNGAGGGGGGRIYFAFGTRWDVSQWTGVTHVSGGPSSTNRQSGFKGESGQQGSIMSNTVCPPGRTGVFCKPCPIGSYKADSGRSDCLPCANAPLHGVYTEEGSTSSKCPYNCAKGFDAVDSNPLCLDDFQRFLNVVGGWGSLIGIFVGILMFVVLVVLWRKHLLHRKSKRQQFLAHRHNRLSRADSDAGSLLVGSQPLVAQDIKPEFGSEDLPYHLHRIYLLGDNCYFRPWGLPQHPPRAIADLFIAESYGRFVEGCNELSSWQLWEHVVWVVLAFLYFPLAYAWLWYRRQLRADWLRQYVSTCDQGFWRSLRARNLSNSLKFTSSPDHTLAYLDIMDYDRSLMDWTAKPVLPLVACLEGDGSYFWPFQLPSGDPLFESISLYTGKPIFDAFFDGFNAVARTVCGPYNGSGPAATVHALTKHITNMNEELFKCCSLSLSLCVFKSCCSGSNGRVDGKSKTTPIALCYKDSKITVDSTLTNVKGDLMCILDSCTGKDGRFWSCFKLGVVVRDLRDEVQVVVFSPPDNVEEEDDEPDVTMLTTTACATSPLPWLVANRMTRLTSDPAFRGSPALPRITRTPKGSIQNSVLADVSPSLHFPLHYAYTDRSPFSSNRSQFTDTPRRVSRHSIDVYHKDVSETSRMSLVGYLATAVTVMFRCIFCCSYIFARSVLPKNRKLLVLLAFVLFLSAEMLILSFVLYDYRHGGSVHQVSFQFALLLPPATNFIATALSIPWLIFQSPRLGRIFQSFNVLSMVNCVVILLAEVIVLHDDLARAFVLIAVKFLNIQVSNYLQAELESACKRNWSKASNLDLDHHHEEYSDVSDPSPIQFTPLHTARVLDFK